MPKIVNTIRQHVEPTNPERLPTTKALTANQSVSQFQQVSSLSRDHILYLQRTIGNQAVTRMMVGLYHNLTPRIQRLQNSDLAVGNVVIIKPKKESRKTKLARVRTVPEKGDIGLSMMGGREKNKIVHVSAENLELLHGGLAQPDSINEFAQEVYDFWKNPEYQQVPLGNFANSLADLANQFLRHESTGSYGFLSVYSFSGSALGQFDPNTWELGINLSKFSKREGVETVGQLNADEVGDIATTFYHESRHAEQFFRMARVRAARLIDGKKTAQASIDDSSAKLAKQMSIPLEVAKAAMEKPLVNEGENKPLVAEANAWKEYYGKDYQKYVGFVQSLGKWITAVTQIINGADEGSDKITKIDTSFSKWNKALDTLSGEHKAAQSADKKGVDLIGRHIKEFEKGMSEIEENLTMINEGKNADYTQEVFFNAINIILDELAKEQYDAYKGFEIEADAHAVEAGIEKAFKALGKDTTK